MSTTAQGLLNDKPTEAEVERVDALWGMFNSTTQFVAALQQVLINREALDYESRALEKFLPILAQAEATSMNVPLAELATHHPTDNMPKPEWEFNTPVKFWELSLSEQMVYTSAYGAEFQSSHNKSGYAKNTAQNALYSFWRHHGNPRHSFPNEVKFRFGNDDWGY